MSGKGDTATSGEKGGVLDSVKQAGESLSNAVSKKTGGSQVSEALSLAYCVETGLSSIHISTGVNVSSGW